MDSTSSAKLNCKTAAENPNKRFYFAASFRSLYSALWKTIPAKYFRRNFLEY